MSYDKGLALVLLLSACAGPAGEPQDGCQVRSDCADPQVCVFLAGDAESGTCATPAGPGPGLPGTNTSVELNVLDALDVLFLVDDSPAIAGREAQIAAAMTDFADALLAARPKISLRVGVTSTDAGNPGCGGALAAGSLRAETCRARLADFTAEVDGVAIDARPACTDVCALEDLALRPSATRDDPEPRVRPWLEYDAAGGNLGPVALSDALACAVPQGIAGCGFTSPLASVEAVLRRASDPKDPAYGFLRDDTNLVVIVLSASNDCSVAAGHEDIFVDQPAFWGELSPPDLTPAVCWRAGVTCEGPGPVYAGCTAADLDVDGQATDAAGAVLVPPGRLAEQLVELELTRELFDFQAHVLLYSIAGVPQDPAGPVPFADAADPAFQTYNGIGPGCEAPDMAAPPPVRLLALADAAVSALAPSHVALSEPPRFASICQPDLKDSFIEIAATAGAWLTPLCLPSCAADLDRDTPELDVACEVAVFSIADGSSSGIPPCVPDGDGWVPPAGSPRCFATRTGAALDPRCEEEGFNVEFELIRTAPDPPDIRYSAGCVLSDNKLRDCPKL